ncbi:MAG TPA: hypothetical protein PK771_12645 [Spirochaetota bacterium]|nr:hypothetical protein [Spirochaetota bacterium]
MNTQKEELEKLYEIRDRLKKIQQINLKQDDKDKITSYLRDTENSIKEIEAGNWINPLKINQIKENLKQFDNIIDNTTIDEDIDFDVEKIEIIPNSKDVEMNTLYSYYKYFEDNFLTALNQSYLKLDYNLGKKRDDLFVKNDMIRHLIEEYGEDMNVLTSITNKEQSDKYRERLSHQKKYLFIKLSEYLRDFLDFLNTTITDINSGRKNIFNLNEKFLPKFTRNNNKNAFENLKFKDIIMKTKDFIEIFIDVLRLPDFKRK